MNYETSSIARLICKKGKGESERERGERREREGKNRDEHTLLSSFSSSSARFY